MANPPTPETQQGGREWTVLGGEFREPLSADVLNINDANPQTGQRAIALALYAIELTGSLAPGWSDEAREAALREVETKLIEARDLTYDYGLNELRTVRELTKRYTPKTVPLLREVRRMAGEINARQIDPTPMINPEISHIVETMLRIVIADELGFDIPRPQKRGAVQ